MSTSASGAAGRAYDAVATLYHAWYTGSILMVASRRGEAVVGEWVRRTFRRQHEAKFLASFRKLGLEGLPPAVACARYHYLSNRIGGVTVEYMEESARKAWVRFPHPRWLYDGTALCGVPESVSHGFLRGWYAQNGVSLRNPRLGFVCTSQDMTAQYGFSGYFVEEAEPLGANERLRFRSDECPPPFDATAAPRLDPATWTAARLAKAKRNYAMDYVANGLAELVAQLGNDGAALMRHAARLVGRQLYPRVAQVAGLEGPGPAGFAAFLALMAEGEGGSAAIATDDGTPVVTWPSPRLLREARGAEVPAFEAWAGLWEGCLSTHDRFLRLEAVRTTTGAELRLQSS